MKKSFLTLLIAFLFVVSAAAQNYTIQQYLNIRSAGSPALAPDGRRLFYLTNVTGTSQVWTIELPGGAPRQITNYDDNVSFVSFSPKGDRLVFGKARGGDENTQFFTMNADGGDIKPLTDAPKVRHNFGGWAEDGTRIFYASNRRNPQFFDIYSMDVATGREELLFQQDGNNDFEAVDPAGSRAVVSRSGTELSLDNNLYLVDLKTKTETLLTPHTGAALFGHPHFLADGLLFGQNDNREFYSLSYLRLKNAADKSNWSAANLKTELVDAAPWDVEDVETLAYGDKIAYTLNREGFSELYLRKYETNGKPLISVIDKKAEMIKLPARGIVGGLDFSENGKFLAFSFSSARSNGDIWLYDLEKKTLTQVTKSDRAGVDQNTFIEPQLVKYKTFDGREIPAWYYKPVKATEFVEGPKVNGVPQSIRKINPVPVIVSVHGGPEGQERPGFNPLYQFYLSRGYAILATNVRGSTGYGKTYTHLDDVRKREDSVKDLAFAVDWLKKSGGADPKRIAVMGGSYGGYMTLAAITLYPDLWAAAVDTVGIANWESFLKNTSGYRRRQREVEYGMLDKDLDFLRSISPLAKVDRIKCPLFVIQGKNDPRVPYTEAEQIVNALKKRNAIVQYKLYDDEGHGIAKLKNRLDLYPQVADFLDKYMK
ncbi:MAG: S9 family peptidase [Acidobacteria bacterium]|nr:S9 family peptidase [Acidobacteriota bacterium]